MKNSVRSVYFLIMLCRLFSIASGRGLATTFLPTTTRRPRIHTGEDLVWKHFGFVHHHLAQNRHFACAAILRGGDDQVPRDANDVDASTTNIADKNHRLITYITDIEGDREYLARYVKQSRILCFRIVQPTTALPYDHCVDFARSTDDMLVFGGDIWDQGGFDLYVIRQLLDLKQRYPNRVHLVLGNRDINKMRLVAELGSSDDTMPAHPGVEWFRGTNRLGDPEQPNIELQDPVQRLKWILQFTMGSPRAFEHRKQELEKEAKGQPVSEADVVDSYRKSCHPDGEMGRYLAAAQLAVRLGDVLFVHGSLPLTKEVLAQGDTNATWQGDLRIVMPWLEPGAEHNVESVTDWIDSLNDFAQQEIAEWTRNPPSGIWSRVGGYHNLPSDDMRSGARLIQYGMGGLPDRTKNPTIVYASWGTDGMPRRFFPPALRSDQRFAEATKAFFQASGIRLICSGHQPQGDMPNAIRVAISDDRICWILCSDTSYSGDVVWYDDEREQPGREGSLSGRGQRAVSEVLLTQNLQTGKIVMAICHGTLSDGSKYESKPLAWTTSDDGNEQMEVGSVAEGPLVPDRSPHNGPWWTRAAFADGSYLLAAGEGYNAWNCIIKPEQ
eukprot:scaffold175_cov177-Amphora_coffeaeformis.AAC.3